MRWPKRNEYFERKKTTPSTNTFENSLRHVKKPVTALNFPLQPRFFLIFWNTSRGPAKKSRITRQPFEFDRPAPAETPEIYVLIQHLLHFLYFWGNNDSRAVCFPRAADFRLWLITRNENLLRKSNDQKSVWELNGLLRMLKLAITTMCLIIGLWLIWVAANKLSPNFILVSILGRSLLISCL